MFIYRLYYLTCFRNSRPSLPTQAGYQEWKARFANQILRGGTTGGRSWWKINKRKVGEEGRVFQKISFSRCLVVAVWTKVKRRMKVSRFPSRATRVSKYLGRCSRSKWKTRRLGQYARRFLTNGQVNVRGVVDRRVRVETSFERNGEE